MRVGVPAELAPSEHRVALTPDAVSRLVDGRVRGRWSRPAPEPARRCPTRPIATPAQPWARSTTCWAQADIVVHIGKIGQDEVSRLRAGQVVIGYVWPLIDPDLVQSLAAAGVTAFGMESVPRVTRAQRMDALSSQATVAGYKAVIIAAERLPRFFPMLMTAAGTVAPAKVLVLGAGVAGLQAIATARRLGGVVSAFDTRPVVKEQVESLGAKFVELDVGGGQDERGYATALTPEQQAPPAGAAGGATSPTPTSWSPPHWCPGRPAPRLIPASAVEAMRAGLGDRRPGGRDRRQLRADRARRDGHNVPDDVIDRRHAQPAGHHAAARQPDVCPKRPGGARSPGLRRRAAARLRRRDHRRRDHHPRRPGHHPTALQGAPHEREPA